MASSTCFAIPPSSSSQAREPVTPTSGLRNRFSIPQQTSQNTPGVGSPTSSTSTTISNLSRIEPSRTLYRSLTSAPTSALGSPARKIIIRADPAIFTCFNPSDKELYDLWAPRS